MPERVLWDPKGTFQEKLDRWDRAILKEMQRQEKERQLSKGAWMILSEFEQARKSGVDDGWISIRDLTIRTGLQAVSTRISELHGIGVETEWNHRSGPESKHRLKVSEAESVRD